MDFCSVAKSCLTLCDPVGCSIQAPLSFTISQSLLRFMSSESVILSSHLTLCHSLLFLPSIFPNIRVFSSESALHIRWAKYWSFRFRTVLLMNIQGRFPLGLTGLIALQSKGLSRVFSNTTVQKHQFFGFQPFLWSKIPWRREWLPTPVSWPPEFHGLYSLWGCKEPGMTEWFPLSFFSHPTLIPTRWT